MSEQQLRSAHTNRRKCTGQLHAVMSTAFGYDLHAVINTAVVMTWTRIIWPSYDEHMIC